MLITGARVVTPGGTRGPLSLVVERDRIKRIFVASKRDAPVAAKTLKLDHLTLFPGFVDVHTHGAVGVDVMDASADDLLRVSLYLAQHGVTAWLPTFVPAATEDYKRSVHAVAQLIREQTARPPGARALGLHYEGPFVNQEQCGALRPKYFRTYSGAADLSALPVLKTAGARHMMTLAPEIEGGIKLISELKRRGWIVSLGHTRADAAVLDEAAAAGAHHMTHFFNAMQGLHHREPGVVGWGLLRDDATCDVIADGVHVDPEALRLLLRVKQPERVTLISDSVAPAGMGNGQYQLWGETITVHEGRTENARGHLAGSVINLSDAARTLRSLGYSDGDIAQMAAQNPARLLGLERECGTIEEGKRADLVALDDEYRVRLTIVGGQVAFDAALEGR